MFSVCSKFFFVSQSFLLYNSRLSHLEWVLNKAGDRCKVKEMSQCDRKFSEYLWNSHGPIQECMFREVLKHRLLTSKPQKFLWNVSGSLFSCVYRLLVFRDY